MSTVATYASTQPIERNDFWILYSNLLLSYWSIPDVRSRLKSDPAGTLAFFQLPTVANATIQIHNDIGTGDPSFQSQYDLWLEGRETRKYILFIPSEYPQIDLGGASDLQLLAADTVSCCCCSCCPCCSCF